MLESFFPLIALFLIYTAIAAMSKTAKKSFRRPEIRFFRPVRSPCGHGTGGSAGTGNCHPSFP